MYDWKGSFESGLDGPQLRNLLVHASSLAKCRFQSHQTQLKFTFDSAQAARLCVHAAMLNLNFTHGGMRSCEFFEFNPVQVACLRGNACVHAYICHET